MEEEEEEQQFRGEEAGRGIREALCSAYSNHAFPPHPNPSSQPAEFPSLELKRRPAAGKRVRRCGLSFLQCSCVEIKMIWSGRSSTTDGIKVKASVRSVNSVTLYLCFALFLCFRFRFEPKKKRKKSGTWHSGWSMMTDVFWSEPDAKSVTFLNTQPSFWMDRPECHEAHAYIQRNVDLDLCNLIDFPRSANMIQD